MSTFESSRLIGTSILLDSFMEPELGKAIHDRGSVLHTAYVSRNKFIYNPKLALGTIDS